MADIEVLNVNVDIMPTSFDDDDASKMALGSNEGSGLMASSIFTPSAPTPFESIATSSTLNPKLH
jgi:hypothetical protein